MSSHFTFDFCLNSQTENKNTFKVQNSRLSFEPHNMFPSVILDFPAKRKLFSLLFEHIDIISAKNAQYCGTLWLNEDDDDVHSILIRSICARSFAHKYQSA